MMSAVRQEYGDRSSSNQQLGPYLVGIINDALYGISMPLQLRVVVYE